MKPIADIPDDPALPGLSAIRGAGVADAIPTLRLDGRVELRLCGYTPGARATVEVRAGSWRVAVKSYAEDPVQEAALYEALGMAGLARDSGVRVPPLLGWNRDLRLLVLGWLEGPTALELIRDGQGERAGNLAAQWFRRAATLRIRLGPRCDADRALRKASEGIADLTAADNGLGAMASAIAEKLAQTQPEEGPSHLVHGTLYGRHVLDLGDGPGVIDWQRFGQGPLELDAGVFLATVSRAALRHKRLGGEVARAEAAFRAGTAGLLDERAVAWHQATALLHLASKPVSRAGDQRLRASGKPNPQAVALSRVRALLDQAADLARLRPRGDGWAQGGPGGPDRTVDGTLKSGPTNSTTSSSSLGGYRAIITAGGIGTRLLPFSKEIPKEMFPIITRNGTNSLELKPVVQAIFEQLHDAGVRRFFVIVGRGKRAIEDHFSPDFRFLDFLGQKGKTPTSLIAFYEKIESSSLVFLNQLEPRGFGDAVLLGRPFVTGDFLVQAADTFILSRGDDYLHRLATTHQKYKASATILFQEVEDPRQYGVLDGDFLEEGVLRITSAMEKPATPKSNHAIMPIYIFTDQVFRALSEIEPGHGGELQLTDAIQALVMRGKTVIGVMLRPDELRLDLGSPETMIEALKISLMHVEGKTNLGSEVPEPAWPSTSTPPDESEGLTPWAQDGPPTPPQDVRGGPSEEGRRPMRRE
jgi:UTP--glucose-1-phosphate uridylyltransferase